MKIDGRVLTGSGLQPEPKRLVPINMIEPTIIYSRLIIFN